MLTAVFLSLLIVNAWSLEDAILALNAGTERYVFDVSPEAAHAIMGLCALLFVANIGCVSYWLCGKKKFGKYQKVHIIGSSDEDMQSMTEMDI